MVSQASAIPALPSSIDACILLTAGQASAINGVSYKGGAAESPLVGLSMCSWDNATARASVEVGFAFWPSPTAAQAAYDAALTSASQAGSAITPVAGLADAAAIAQQAGAEAVTGDGWIFIRRGTLVVAVGYYGGTAPTDAALKAAATSVLAKLPLFAR
jgi:hypothetical protein